MKEFELSDPVSAWLKSRGLKVYAEVNSIDLVGISADESLVVCVELKKCLTRKVISQVLRRPGHELWCAVATKPKLKNVEILTQYGVGLISISDGNPVVLVEAKNNDGDSFEYSRANLIGKCRHMAEDGTGGHPTRLGAGPAIEFEKRMSEYREANPGTTWADIFKNVPHHYSSIASMRSAFYMNQRLRSARLKRKQP